MDRFFVQPGAWNDATLLLEGDEVHHCARVMRKSVGDEIELFDGEGRWARGGIEEVSSGTVRVEVGERGESEVLVPRITLAVAIPKGKTMDILVQKAVELGVGRIQPLVTERTVVRIDDGAKKRAKWQRIALEACKQCGQNLLPTVEEPLALGEWLAGREGGVMGLVASLAKGAREFRVVLREVGERPARVDLLIGPEGDFAGGEMASALAAGFLPVSLGNIVLRVETAALYCLGAVRYEFGA